ncbi:MAG: folate-binding protein [Pseudomonadota bacterium]
MDGISTPYCVKLPDRGLIHLEGADRHEFLQALISNDMNKLKSGKALYACLLTPQGKFLHDFFIHEGDGFLLMDCEGGERAQDLFKRLNMYRLRKDVQLSVEEHNDVYAVFGQDSGVPDPRHTDMGYRSFEKPEVEERPFEVWDRHRIALTIPDGSRDIVIERSTLLECGLDHLHAIDWDKGCYMGQELTARMHYRGLAKKHLYTVHNKNKGENLAEAFTKLDNGMEMRSSCGDIGLALLKDDEAEKLKDDDGTIRILGL